MLQLVPFEWLYPLLLCTLNRPCVISINTRSLFVIVPPEKSHTMSTKGMSRRRVCHKCSSPKSCKSANSTCSNRYVGWNGPWAKDKEGFEDVYTSIGLHWPWQVRKNKEKCHAFLCATPIPFQARALFQILISHTQCALMSSLDYPTCQSFPCIPFIPQHQ